MFRATKIKTFTKLDNLSFSVFVFGFQLSNAILFCNFQNVGQSCLCVCIYVWVFPSFVNRFVNFDCCFFKKNNNNIHFYSYYIIKIFIMIFFVLKLVAMINFLFCFCSLFCWILKKNHWFYIMSNVMIYDEYYNDLYI